jgi:hypothetical protein
MEAEIDPEDELERLRKQYLTRERKGASAKALKKISDKYFALLEDVRREDLSSEIEWAALLIENDVIEPNIFNTFEWTNTCAEQIEDPLETETHLSNTYPLNDDWKYPLFQDDDYLFDDHWKDLDLLKYHKEYMDKNFDENEVFYYRENGVFFNPLEQFLFYVRGGEIPRPELLLSVAKAFHLYFCRQGELTLEEVFFGKPTKSGSYAKRRSENFKGIDFRTFEHSVRRNYDNSTLEELAEIFILNKMNENECSDDLREENSSLGAEDVDSFLRKYRRWKTKQGIKKSPKKANLQNRDKEAHE